MPPKPKPSKSKPKPKPKVAARTWNAEDAALQREINMELGGSDAPRRAGSSSSSQQQFHPNSYEPDGDGERGPRLVSEHARRKQQQQQDMVPCFSLKVTDNGIRMSWGTAFIFAVGVFALAYATFSFILHRPTGGMLSSSSDSSNSSGSTLGRLIGAALGRGDKEIAVSTAPDPAHLALIATLSIDLGKSITALNQSDPLGRRQFLAAGRTPLSPSAPLRVQCPTCAQVCGNVNPFANETIANASIIYSPTQTPKSTRIHNQIPSFQGELNRLFSDRPSPFMRWEDPEAYKAMQKLHGRWSERDEKMYSVTAEPIKYDTDEKRNLMKFSPERFRQLNIPILWADTNEQSDEHHNGHVHWNAAAEKRFMEVMRKRQFPQPPVDCTKVKYLIVDQWGSGFFSRYNIGMEQLWRASNIMDRMVIIGFGPMGVGGASIQAASHDDFAGQGITQYFAPSSQCSDHPFIMKVLQIARSGPAGFADMSRQGYPAIRDFQQIQPGGEYYNQQIVHMCESWCDGHGSHGAYSPYRRIIFDPRLDPVNYEEEVWRDLESNSLEHIYPCDSAECASAPMSIEQFKGTVQQRHRLWTEFYLMMLSGFFFQLSPRIHVLRNLVADYWTSQMLRKQNILPTNENTDVAYYAEGERHFSSYEAIGQLRDLDPKVKLHPLSNSAAIFVRRGDKCPDDAYCVRTGHFRGIGLFLYGVYQEELRRGKQFDSIFVMTDDGPALDRLLVEMNGEKDGVKDPAEVFKLTPRSTQAELEEAMKSRDDNIIAKAILKGRWVTHNNLAPASCFNPANRQGFEGFLVSLSYMLTHSSYMVGHESSNVFWMVGRIVYAMNQLDPRIKRTGIGARVVNVGDDFN